MAVNSKKSNEISGDEMTLAGRIRLGMAKQGIANGNKLAEKLKLRRQTVSKWLNGDVVDLDSASLFSLADVLQVNPRWLAWHQGDPAPPREVGPDDRRILDLHKALPPKARAAWLRQGDDLLEATGQTSVEQPFKK